MTNDTFYKILRYLQLDPDDHRAVALNGLFVGGMTKAEAARASGMTPGNLNTFVARTLADLRRAGDLTGVYIDPVIRRGIPGRKA